MFLSLFIANSSPFCTDSVGFLRSWIIIVMNILKVWSFESISVKSLFKTELVNTSYSYFDNFGLLLFDYESGLRDLIDLIDLPFEFSDFDYSVKGKGIYIFDSCSDTSIF